MISQDEKIKLFLNAISENLEMRRKEIDAEIAEVRKQEHEKAEMEAAERSDAFIKIESEKIHSQTNRTSTAFATELRNELAAKRSSITDSVFEAVCEKLIAFVKTTEYTDFMLRSVERILSFYGKKGVTVYIGPADMHLKDKIIEAVGSNCIVTADDSILIGGCKATCEGNNVSLDDTLDARLNEQKQVFYENSGLSVQSV